MPISSKTREKWNLFSADDKDRIIRMAWEDRSSFESIRTQFSLSPGEVVGFMRRFLNPQAFRRWRRRATEQGQLKHEKTRPKDIQRFKCSRQRLDGSTKGWK